MVKRQLIPLDELELKLVAQLQSYVRGELARNSITVETNPTSNILIDGMTDIRQHPVFELCPVEAAQSSQLVSVSTDNPLTFSTSLGDEYGWLYLAMRRNGVPEDTAIGWIDRVRETGWRSRSPSQRAPMSPFSSALARR